MLLLAALAVTAPSVVLSAAPPMIVKLQLATLRETGTVVGRLSGVGTVGAIAGTFLTGFVLVRLLTSDAILVSTGALLVVGLALAAYLRRGDRYHCASVVADPTYLEFNYVHAIASVLDTVAPTGAPLDVLHLGGGGLTLPRYLEATTRPGGRNVVLEVDPGVAEIALGLRPPTGPDLDLRIVDARVGLRELPGGSYDVVVGDAVGGVSVPWHLTTRETVLDVRRTLRPGGVYALNVIDYPPASLARAELPQSAACSSTSW